MTVLIQPGELNRRITLQARSTSKSAFGAQVATWSDVATVWARIEPRAGAEPIEAGSLRGVLSHVIRIRYRSGVVPAMRVLYGSRILDVTSVVDVDEAHVALDLYCAEGLTKG